MEPHTPVGGTCPFCDGREAMNCGGWEGHFTCPPAQECVLARNDEIGTPDDLAAFCRQPGALPCDADYQSWCDGNVAVNCDRANGFVLRSDCLPGWVCSAPGGFYASCEEL